MTVDPSYVEFSVGYIESGCGSYENWNRRSIDS